MEKFNKSAIISVVKSGDLKILDFCLNNGYDVNAESSSKNTPLHFAMKKLDSEVIEILIKHGADLYKKNKAGDTPIDFLLESSTGNKKSFDNFVTTLKTLNKLNISLSDPNVIDNEYLNDFLRRIQFDINHFSKSFDEIMENTKTLLNELDIDVEDYVLNYHDSDSLVRLMIGKKEDLDVSQLSYKQIFNFVSRMLLRGNEYSLNVEYEKYFFEAIKYLKENATNDQIENNIFDIKEDSLKWSNLDILQELSQKTIYVMDKVANGEWTGEVATENVNNMYDLYFRSEYDILSYIRDKFNKSVSNHLNDEKERSYDIIDVASNIKKAMVLSLDITKFGTRANLIELRDSDGKTITEYAEDLIEYTEKIIHTKNAKSSMDKFYTQSFQGIINSLVNELKEFESLKHIALDSYDYKMINKKLNKDSKGKIRSHFKI